MNHPNTKVPEEERCPRCLGWGFVIRYTGDDEKTDVDCLRCDGTGRRKVI